MLFFIPLVVLIFCYSRIIYVMHKAACSNLHTDTPSSNTQQVDKKGAKYLKAKKNTIKIMLLVSACFIFCWSWNQTYFLLYNVGTWHERTYIESIYTILIFLCNARIRLGQNQCILKINRIEYALSMTRVLVGGLNFSNNFYHFTVVMVCLNCCLNPIIYAAKYQEFQEAATLLMVTICPGAMCFAKAAQAAAK